MHVINSAVVGIKFNPGAHDKLVETESGTEVTLVREPDNRFDANAIAVVVDGFKVGHIPAPQAAKLAPYMDAGKPLTCRLRGHNKLEIEVEEKDEDHGKPDAAA